MPSLFDLPAISQKFHQPSAAAPYLPEFPSSQADSASRQTAHLSAAQNTGPSLAIQESPAPGDKVDEFSGLANRLQRLSPQAEGQWGRLNAHAVLCHLSDTFEYSLGSTGNPEPGPLVFLPFRACRRLILHTGLPWPRRFRAPAFLLSRQPVDFEADRRELLRWIDRFQRQVGEVGHWVPHPVLGALKPDEWAAFHCRHIDHHLRQFGC